MKLSVNIRILLYIGLAISACCPIFTSQQISSMDTPVVYLFSHGMIDSSQQINSYTRYNPTTHTNNERFIIDVPFATFNFPDASNPILGIKGWKFWQSSLGGRNEIDALANAYDETVKICPSDYGIVLVGLSRGASVTLSFTALYKPDRVRALVVESPFDSVTSLIEGIHRNMPYLLQKVPGIQSFIGFIMRFLAARRASNEAQPIDIVDQIPQDLPILIVCSQEDTLVEAKSSIRLYRKLRESGHVHAYLLVLPHGDHAKLLQGPNGDIYEQTVHAFYERYNLPHDPVRAALGRLMLGQCQPDYK